MGCSMLLLPCRVPRSRKEGLGGCPRQSKLTWKRQNPAPVPEPKTELTAGHWGDLRRDWNGIALSLSVRRVGMPVKNPQRTPKREEL